MLSSIRSLSATLLGNIRLLGAPPSEAASSSVERHVEHNAVGYQHGALRGGECCVEQPERAHDSLDLSGERSALQAYVLAHAEGPGAEQDGAGDQVAQRLLRGEAEDDGGERSTEGQRARFDARDAQRDEQGEHGGGETDEEAHGPRGGGIDAPEQRGSERAAGVAGERPAEDQERDHCRRPERRFQRFCKLVVRRVAMRGRHARAQQAQAIVEEHDDRREQHSEHQRLHARALRRARADVVL